MSTHNKKKRALLYYAASCLLWIAFLFIYLYCLMVFLNLQPIPSKVTISWLSVVICIICLLKLRLNKKLATFGLTSVLLLYTMLTQFGLGTVYYILGSEFLSNYNNFTLRFLFSDQYVKAVLLGIIAVMTYSFAASVGSFIGNKDSKKINNTKTNNLIYKNESNYVVWTGYVLLLLVLIYLLFNLFTGQFSLRMDYTSYMESNLYNSSIYNYVLVFYSVGIAYVISAGNKRQIKLGILIFSFSALLFFLTGNKGEVLYATLACIGVSQYRGFRIKPLFVILMSLLVFVFIPFITDARKDGILGSIDKIGISFTSFFTEVGMQLRLNVYILEQFHNNLRDFLYGFSYYNPLINIIDNFIPFYSIRLDPPLDFNFKEVFPGYGFNQVAEGYANYGLLGVILFFFILGILISKMESNKLNPLKLAYLTSIVSVLINVTRNSFAFVPGQIFILTVFYLFLLFIVKRAKK